MLGAVCLPSPPRMVSHHPYIAGVVCANFFQLLFLPLPLFSLCESTGACDGRSPPRLLSQLQGLRLPALLQRAAKSPLPAAHHKPRACLSPSLPFPSLLLPRNPDLSPADRVEGRGNLQMHLLEHQKQRGPRVMFLMPLTSVARR